MSDVIRVLVVDDSAVVRAVLKAGLSADPMIDVVGCAVDPYDAREKILELRPDVLTLDVEMPRMSGIEFLRRLMPHYPLPVVMVSSRTQKGQKITLEALAAGAVDFLPKPSNMRGEAVGSMLDQLARKIRVAATANVSHWKRGAPARGPSQQVERDTSARVIAIGASTGGVEALQQVLSRMPLNCPSILIAQHMLPGFTDTFSRRLDELCAIKVEEARDNETLVRGRALIAPGDRHLTLEQQGRRYVARLVDSPPVNRHRPSVDVLLRSVAEAAGPEAVGVLLTGMGRDGAEGLKVMRQAGAQTIAQDEESSVVYGMPRAALEVGAVDDGTPLSEIAQAILTERRKAA